MKALNTWTREESSPPPKHMRAHTYSYMHTHARTLSHTQGALRRTVSFKPHRQRHFGPQLSEPPTPGCGAAWTVGRAGQDQ